MARQSIPIEVTPSTDVGTVVEEVIRTGVPRVLRRDGKDLAIISPAPKTRRRRPRPRSADVSTLNAWLGDLIGIGESSGPGDISANVHKYVAEAIHAECPSPTPECVGDALR